MRLPHRVEPPTEFIARAWGVFPQPKPNEERVIAFLERCFPNSEWVPNFEPPSASTQSSADDRIPGPFERPGGTGARNTLVVVIGSDGFELEKHDRMIQNASVPYTRKEDETDAAHAKREGRRLKRLEKLQAGREKVAARELELAKLFRRRKVEFVTGSGKNPPEARARELGPERELRPDLYGPRADAAQVEALVALAVDTHTSRSRPVELVLAGTGSRVTVARSVLGRLSRRYWPPLVEL